MLLLQQVGQGAGQQGEDLLGVFSTHISSINNSPLDASALCVYPLDELDRHIDSTRDLCYTQDGLVEGKEKVAYIEYEVKSSCANLPLVSVQESKGFVLDGDADIFSNGRKANISGFLKQGFCQ